MLAWRVEEVKSPYGGVATLHWAVPDSVGDDGDDGNGDLGGLDTLNTTALQVELESAEDQLGAVLWNSNPAALNYLHDHVFRLPPRVDTAQGTTASPSALHLPPLLQGKNVVELGAGVGCLGIALAMAGARVAVTDLKELLPLMAYNVRLNDKRVQTRSQGTGHCVALQWKWGPTVSTSVHKQLQKKCKESLKEDASAVSRAVVEKVLTGMVASLERSSDALVECSKALTSASSLSSSSKPAAATTPYHYVVLCDALYGNPKDWPALLYTLTELMATNPNECEIVNFCEQRVNDVEGAFLALLDAENDKSYIPLTEKAGRGASDPLWEETVTAVLRCGRDATAAATQDKKSPSSGATSSTVAAMQVHKHREEASKALLSYALVQRRGAYKWTYTTEVVSEAQSELDMVIRVTRIRWTRVDGEANSSSSKSQRRPREEGNDDGEGDAEPLFTATRKKNRH